MTGRDGGADLAPLPGESPVIVLVRPQLAENIGTAARAMANGGLFHLRLVAPRDGWPQERAWYASSGADRILDAATVHPTVADAVADCHRVFATCPRPRPCRRRQEGGGIPFACTGHAADVRTQVVAHAHCCRATGADPGQKRSQTGQ